MVENFNRVKEYRVKKGWSVKQLAAAMGCTEAYIRQIEGFKRGMSLSTAKQFSVVLGKSLNTLFMP
jgi:transcriptional regulator with XRE-family HTH domain